MLRGHPGSVHVYALSGRPGSRRGGAPSRRRPARRPGRGTPASRGGNRWLPLDGAGEHDPARGRGRDRQVTPPQRGGVGRTPGRLPVDVDRERVVRRRRAVPLRSRARAGPCGRGRHGFRDRTPGACSSPTTSIQPWLDVSAARLLPSPARRSSPAGKPRPSHMPDDPAEVAAALADVAERYVERLLDDDRPARDRHRRPALDRPLESRHGRDPCRPNRDVAARGPGRHAARTAARRGPTTVTSDASGSAACVRPSRGSLLRSWRAPRSTRTTPVPSTSGPAATRCSWPRPFARSSRTARCRSATAGSRSSRVRATSCRSRCGPSSAPVSTR